MERKKNIWRGFMDTPWWNVFTATCRLILKHWVLDIMQKIHTVKRYNTKNWINWPRSMWLYRKYEEPASTIKFDHNHKNGDCWEFLQARRQKYIRTHPSWRWLCIASWILESNCHQGQALASSVEAEMWGELTLAWHDTFWGQVTFIYIALYHSLKVLHFHSCQNINEIPWP